MQSWPVSWRSPVLWPSRKPVRNTRLPKSAQTHDIAPAADGGVWHTAQHQATLGWLDPKTGKTRHIPLDSSGPVSSPAVRGQDLHNHIKANIEVSQIIANHVI